MKATLKQNYRRYTSKARGRTGGKSILQQFMAEIVYRTTKLEGESVTRRMVNAIFR